MCTQTCTDDNIRFVTSFFYFFAPLGPNKGWHFPKKCSKAAMSQSGKNTGQPTIRDTLIIRVKSPAKQTLSITLSLIRTPTPGPYKGRNKGS